jgi:peptide/nickel transport system substrate-binding protein
VKKLRRTGWGPVLVALLVGLAACGSDSASESNQSGSGEVDREATARIGWASLPSQLDPHSAVSEPIEFRTLNLIYDRLLTINADGSIGPMVATEWAYAEDGMALNLTLREDVQFHDGSPLDAAAVVANIERVRTLPNATGISLTNVVSAEATGPYAVRIGLKAPTTEVPAALASNAGMIINPSLLATGDPSATTDGSGPYVLDEFVPSVSMALKRADDVDEYWDADAAQVARFEFTEFSDPTATTNALRSGQIDFAEITSAERVEELQSQIDSGDFDVVYAGATFTTFYLDRTQAPLDDLEVRAAMNQAIDRETLTDTFFPGSEAAVQSFPEAEPWFNSEVGDPYPFDPEAARERLADAGYPDGIDLGVVMVSNALPDGVAPAVQAMLADAGMTVELQVVDAAQISTAQTERAAPMFIHFSGHRGTPSTNIARRVAPRLNPAGTTPEYDALFAAANDNRLPADEQEAGWQDVSGYLAEEAWFVPLVHQRYANVFDSAIVGVSEKSSYATTLGLYDLRYLAVTS